jgi:hypothetical protein
MGSLGPTHQISLLLAVALIAAICGFIAHADPLSPRGDPLVRPR